MSDSEMQTHGYLIVQRPEALVAAYNSSPTEQENQEILRELREAFSRFDPCRYRGISRDPLGPYPSHPEVIRWEREHGYDVDSNVEAGKRHDEITRELYDNTRPDFDLHLLPTLGGARDVYSLLDDPTQWEVIELSRAHFTAGPGVLGFDVGEWGIHYSLIADTIVMPTWHPPEPEDWAELGDRLQDLNEHLLFDHRDAAEAFPQWYKSRDWAETEDTEGEFCIIQVGAVDVS